MINAQLAFYKCSYQYDICISVWTQTQSGLHVQYITLHIQQAAYYKQVVPIS